MSATVGHDRPLPTSDIWWDGVGEGKVLLLRCPVCAAHWVPWSPHCPECGTASTPEWVQSVGTGTLYSWVVVRHSVGFPDEVPFAVGSVLLDEGAMLYGRVIGIDPSALVGDMPVVAGFGERHGRVVVEFTPSPNVVSPTDDTP
jgi:uncharacterized OB-fold protein